MKALRTLLVDDEPLARLALRQALAPHGDIEVVGEGGDVASARALVADLRPDLLFLDIQLPGADGFELLRDLEAPPLVVFTTAHAEHALAAFEAQAMDYLLKPLDQVRVDQALERVRAQARGMAPRPALSPFLTRLSVRQGDRIHLLRVEDVDWIAAEGNYVALHVGEATFLHRETLSGLEARLDPNRFLRIHRGTLVAVDRVAEVRPHFYGDATLHLRNGARLTLSRRYKEKARALLGF